MSVRCIPCLTLHSAGKMQAPFESVVKFFAGCGVFTQGFPKASFHGNSGVHVPPALLEISAGL